jgi:hypothetical protein
MTQTEKKYSKNVGKLFWSGERNYLHDKQDYHLYYKLVMINGLQKDKYSKKYLYVIEVLSSPYNHGQTYRVECSYFLTLAGHINKYGNGYIPVKTGEVEKDVAQIPKAC